MYLSIYSFLIVINDAVPLVALSTSGGQLFSLLSRFSGQYLNTKM